jgi:hypothetical protein
MSESTPIDIKPQWLSVARRMQSVAKTEGYAVVTISVLVDPDGCPQAWLEPRTCRIEPKRLASDTCGLPTSHLIALAKNGDL